MDKRCQNCGRFPFCERENNMACEKWTKRDIEVIENGQT